MYYVYEITISNMGSYIGSTCKLGSRIREHLTCLLNGNHICVGLQNAVTSTGIEAFSFRVLESYDAIGDAMQRERELILERGNLNTVKAHRIARRTGRTPVHEVLGLDLTPKRALLMKETIDFLKQYGRNPKAHGKEKPLYLFVARVTDKDNRHYREDIANLLISHGAAPPQRAKPLRNVVRSDGTEFPTIAAAARSVEGCEQTIYLCCHGKRKTPYKGYFWKFSEN